MKKMKKLFAMLLALAMVLGMAMTVSAATTTTATATGKAADRGTITVSGIVAETGLKVVAHPIVKAEYNNSESFSGYKAIYGDDTVKIDAETCEITVDDPQLKALLALVDDDKAIEMSPNTAGTSYSASVPVGTYLVQISKAETRIYSNVVVSVRYINSNGQNAIEQSEVNLVASENAWTKIQELPTIDKAIVEGENVLNGNTVKFGDIVDYKITAKIPYYGGQYPVYKVSDELAGLSYTTEPVVTVGTKTLVKGTDYTVDELDADSFVLNFVVGGVYTLNGYEAQDLVVTYKAVVDTDATLNNNANTNEATLSFTKDSKVEGRPGEDKDTTYTYTFDIDAEGTNDLTHAIITKYGQTTRTEKVALVGAEFTLYTDAACKTPYSNSDWNGVVLSDANGQLTMTGLDQGTYYLKETKAPAPYTLNNTVYKIDIVATVNSDGKLVDWTITVDDTVIEDASGTKVNKFEVSGETVVVNEGEDKIETQINNTKIANLPSTGGIGTTIFTVAGCLIMVVAAYFFFVSHRREEA